MYFYHDHCKKDYDYDYHKKDHDCKKYYYYYYYYYYPCFKKYDYDYDYKKFDHFDHCKKKKHSITGNNAILYGWMTSTLFLLPRDRVLWELFLCDVRLNIVIQQLCRLLQDDPCVLSNAWDALFWPISPWTISWPALTAAEASEP